MSAEQLNKLQIKAEILTVISKLQTNIETADVEGVLQVLLVQEDKKVILEILIKELSKANEQKAILICFLLLKLCDKAELEEALWDTLKSPAVSDVIKTIILNVLKDMGNKVEYDKLEEYFENPNNVIDADTQRLLQNAIINPEAQIDFLDFLNSLSDNDGKILITSLGEDYSSDSLANILNPLVLYAPSSTWGKIAIDLIGGTKSQLALHTLIEALDLTDDGEVISLIKKNISKLKISGVREDNAIDFYKGLLASSKPYLSYSSYPDGHGNQAIIFSRQRSVEEDGTIQIVAIVINDTYGLIDCFGFNEISIAEFERIVKRFYNGDDHVCISESVVKSILLNAEKLTRTVSGKISYEYICWKTLLSDIQAEETPFEVILKEKVNEIKLTDENIEKINMLDIVQRWFFDPEYSDEFNALIKSLNNKMEANDFKINFEKVVEDYLDEIFNADQKDLLDKRLLMSAYLDYLTGNNDESKLLYSLYLDESKKREFSKNIIRKSIYEYYVGLKFKYKQEHKMANIFTLKNKPKTEELSQKQIDLAISMIESVWVG